VSVKTVADNAFFGCDTLSDLYYDGTEAEFGEVEISTVGNASLEDANKHFGK
jgi:hypothetical protein